jgi:hypothetical protein
VSKLTEKLEGNGVEGDWVGLFGLKRIEKKEVKKLKIKYFLDSYD